MMKFFAVCMMFLCFCGSVSAEVNSYAERTEVYDQWMKAAKNIAGDDEGAKDVLDFIIANEQKSMPIYTDEGLGIRPLLNGVQKEAKSLLVICLMPGDENTSPEWFETTDNSFAAGFMGDESMSIIVLRAQAQMSDVWKGLLFLHEGFHAMAHVKKFFAEEKDPLRHRVIEEYFAYAMEFNLLRKYGGKAYETLLDKEVVRIKKTDKVAPEYGMYEKELTRIFGKSVSQRETFLRETIFWLNAQFQKIADEVKPENVDDAIATFLLGCYQNEILQ